MPSCVTSSRMPLMRRDIGTPRTSPPYPPNRFSKSMKTAIFRCLTISGMPVLLECIETVRTVLTRAYGLNMFIRVAGLDFRCSKCPLTRVPGSWVGTLLDNGGFRERIESRTKATSEVATALVACLPELWAPLIPNIGFHRSTHRSAVMPSAPERICGNCREHSPTVRGRKAILTPGPLALLQCAHENTSQA